MFFSILLLKGDAFRARQLGDFLQAALPAARISYAYSVQEAACCACQQHFDIVLCAWQLPDGLALDVLPHTASSLGLVIVPAGQEAQAAHAMRSGFTDFAVRDSQGNFRLTLPAQIHALLERMRLRQARQQAEQEVERLAYTDDLTGLPNRRAMLHQLGRCLQRHDGRYGVLLLVGLDGFKNINDAMGHAVGDQILCQMARTIRHWSPAEAVVGRVGGDEFMVILPQVFADSHLARLHSAVAAQELLQCMAEPLDICGRQLRLSSSVGISEFGAETISVTDLVQRASMALHHGKSAGKGSWCLFSSQLQEDVKQRATMEADIHRALEQDEFVLHFQPLVNARG